MLAPDTVTECHEMIRTLRDTNTRLNRRCQVAESAARQNVDECKRHGTSLGRALANWAATDAERRLEQASVEKGTAAGKVCVDPVVRQEIVWAIKRDILNIGSIYQSVGQVLYDEPVTRLAERATQTAIRILAARLRPAPTSPETNRK